MDILLDKVTRRVRKVDCNIFDQAVGEVKKFIVVALLTALKFIEPSLDIASATTPFDWDFYDHKLTALVIRMTFNAGTDSLNVHSLLIELCRH